MRILTQMLRYFLLIHTIKDHILLNLFYLHQLSRQMLVWRLELEVSFEIHLGLLLKLVCYNKVLHLQTILLGLLLSLACQSLWVIFLEVFKFEFLFLDECAIVGDCRLLIVSGIMIFANIVASQAWICSLNLKLLQKMGIF